MKTTNAVISPVILLACGVWFATQSCSIAGLEDQTARPQQAVTPAQGPATNAARPVAANTPLDKKPVDWAEVARQLKQGKAERLDARFKSMSRDDLLAALDEIAAAALPKDDRELLERRICDELVRPEGGPELVLNRFARHYREGIWAWTLASYFQDWINKEPDQAIAWLHRHAGEMGNPDQLVSQSFYPRLTSDPVTAIRILKALPESKRLESLRTLDGGSSLVGDAKQQIAWVKIIRVHLPKKDRLEAVIWPTLNWADGDGARMSMEDVGIYMDHIQAAPIEREACVLSAAGGLGEPGTFVGDFHKMSAAEKIEKLRTWVAVQAPKLIDRATGMGLSGLVGSEGFSYADLAAMALRYHDSSPSDDLLIPLLEGHPGERDQASVRAMAERLSDANLRRKYLERDQ